MKWELSELCMAELDCDSFHFVYFEMGITNVGIFFSYVYSKERLYRKVSNAGSC